MVVVTSTEKSACVGAVYCGGGANRSHASLSEVREDTPAIGVDNPVTAKTPRLSFWGEGGTRRDGLS